MLQEYRPRAETSLTAAVAGRPPEEESGPRQQRLLSRQDAFDEPRFTSCVGQSVQAETHGREAPEGPAFVSAK